MVNNTKILGIACQSAISSGQSQDMAYKAQIRRLSRLNHLPYCYYSQANQSGSERKFGRKENLHSIYNMAYLLHILDQHISESNYVNSPISTYNDNQLSRYMNTHIDGYTTKPIGIIVDCRM